MIETKRPHRNAFWNVIALAFFVSGFSVPAFSAETILKYTLVEVHAPSPAAPKKDAHETRTVTKKTVILGEKFFSVEENNQKRIYDFAHRRVHYLDQKAKTHADIPLFADVAFRINEFQNRIKMGDVIEKAGGLPPEDIFSLESIFGILAENRKVPLVEETKGDSVFFSENKKVMLELLFSKKNAEPISDEFNKFLIYDNSLHPAARKKIIEKGIMPKVIRNELQNMNATTKCTLILDSFKKQPALGIQIPKDFSLSDKIPGAVESSGKVMQLIRDFESARKAKEKHAKDWYFSRVDEAIKNKDYLDAALFVMEFGLQTGDQAAASTEMQKIAPFQAQDAELNRFFRSLGIGGKEQAQIAVSELQKIDRSHLQRPHVLDVMIANQKAQLEQADDAEALLIGAIHENPYLAGAYMDLGDLFHRRFDMATAWLCWDFARGLYPKHWMLQPIDAYQEKLLADFPEFF